MWTGISRLTDEQWRLVVCVSDVSSAMWLVRAVQLALLQGVASLNARVEGELALDIRVAGGGGTWVRVAWPAGSQVAQKLLFKIRRPQVTVAPALECVYQFPEKAQVDALLSDMMNELAKVFVRANEYMKSLETQRIENELKQENRQSFNMQETFVKRGANRVEPVEPEKKEPVKERPRVQVSRFKVVNEKKKSFFERLYRNMTDEYRNFYNATFERADRARGDHCSRQPELKQMWLQLLQRSQDTLRSAAKRLVQKYLAETPAENKAQMRKRLKQFLKAELGRVRANQLDMLCDIHQLCYSDLL